MPDHQSDREKAQAYLNLDRQHYDALLDRLITQIKEKTPGLSSENASALRDYFAVALGKGTSFANIPLDALGTMSPAELNEAAQQLSDKLSPESRKAFANAAADRTEAARWDQLFPNGGNEIFFPLATANAKSVNDGVAAFIAEHNQRAQATYDAKYTEETALIDQGKLDPTRRTAGKEISQRQIRLDPDNAAKLQTYNASKDRWDAGSGLGKYLNECNQWALLDDFMVENSRKEIVGTKKTNDIADVQSFMEGNRNGADAYDPSSLMVVISRDPQKIGEMSSGQHWRSCMAEGGVNFHYVPMDIEAGSLVAYVVSKNDPEARYPLMRQMIKPYRNVQTGETVMIPAIVYGADSGNDSFTRQALQETLANFTREHINGTLSGTFNMDPRLYGDGQATTVSLRSEWNKESSRQSLVSYYDSALQEWLVELQTRESSIEFKTEDRESYRQSNQDNMVDYMQGQIDKVEGEAAVYRRKIATLQDPTELSKGLYRQLRKSTPEALPDPAMLLEVAHAPDVAARNKLVYDVIKRGSPRPLMAYLANQPDAEALNITKLVSRFTPYADNNFTEFWTERAHQLGTGQERLSLAKTLLDSGSSGGLNQPEHIAGGYILLENIDAIPTPLARIETLAPLITNSPFPQNYYDEYKQQLVDHFLSDASGIKVATLKDSYVEYFRPVSFIIKSSALSKETRLQAMQAMLDHMNDLRSADEKIEEAAAILREHQHDAWVPDALKQRAQEVIAQNILISSKQPSDVIGLLPDTPENTEIKKCYDTHRNINLSDEGLESWKNKLADLPTAEERFAAAVQVFDDARIYNFKGTEKYLANITTAVLGEDPKQLSAYAKSRTYAAIIKERKLEGSSQTAQAADKLLTVLADPTNDLLPEERIDHITELLEDGPGYLTTSKQRHLCAEVLLENAHAVSSETTPTTAKALAAVLAEPGSDLEKRAVSAVESDLLQRNAPERRAAKYQINSMLTHMQQGYDLPQAHGNLLKETINLISSASENVSHSSEIHPSPKTLIPPASAGANATANPNKTNFTELFNSKIKDQINPYVNDENASVVLRNNPEAVKAVEHYLDTHFDSQKLKFLGYGARAFAVEVEGRNEILRFVRSDLESERVADPKILQPSHTGEVDGIRIEKMPKVLPLNEAIKLGIISAERAKERIEEVKIAFAHEGKFVWDDTKGNFALLGDNKTLVVLDADAVCNVTDIGSSKIEGNAQKQHAEYERLLEKPRPQDKWSGVQEALYTSKGNSAPPQPQALGSTLSFSEHTSTSSPAMSGHGSTVTPKSSHTAFTSGENGAYTSPAGRGAYEESQANRGGARNNRQGGAGLDGDIPLNNDPRNADHGSQQTSEDNPSQRKNNQRRTARKTATASAAASSEPQGQTTNVPNKTNTTAPSKTDGTLGQQNESGVGSVPPGEAPGTREGMFAAGSIKATEATGVIVGAYGLYNQVNSPTFKQDMNAGGNRATYAETGVTLNGAAVTTGVVGMLTKTKFLGEAGLLFAAVAGGFEGAAAQEAGDGHRQAQIYGSTAGAIGLGLVGTAVGTSLGAAAAGAVLGTEVPLYGQVAGAVAGFALGTYATIEGAKAGGKAFDVALGTHFQEANDKERIEQAKQKQKEIAAISEKAAHNQEASTQYAALAEEEQHIHAALDKHPRGKTLEALKTQETALAEKRKHLPEIKPFTAQELNLVANCKSILDARYQEQLQQSQPNPDAVKLMGQAASVVNDLWTQVNGQANAAQFGQVYIHGTVTKDGKKVTDDKQVDAHLLVDLPTLAAVPAIVKDAKNIVRAEAGNVFFTQQHDLATVAYRELFGELPGSVNRVIYDHDKIGLENLKEGVKRIVDAHQEKFLHGSLNERQAIAYELYQAYVKAPATRDANSTVATKSEIQNAMAILHRAGDMQEALYQGISHLPPQADPSHMPFSVAPFADAKAYQAYASQAFKIDKPVHVMLTDAQINAQLKDLLPALEKNGWHHLIKAAGKHLTHSKDPVQDEVNAVKAILQSSGVTLASLDVNGDGHLNGAELTAALNKGLKKDQSVYR